VFRAVCGNDHTEVCVGAGAFGKDSDSFVLTNKEPGNTIEVLQPARGLVTSSVFIRSISGGSETHAIHTKVRVEVASQWLRGGSQPGIYGGVEEVLDRDRVDCTESREQRA